MYTFLTHVFASFIQNKAEGALEPRRDAARTCDMASRRRETGLCWPTHGRTHPGTVTPDVNRLGLGISVMQRRRIYLPVRRSPKLLWSGPFACPVALRTIIAETLFDSSRGDRTMVKCNLQSTANALRITIPRFHQLGMLVRASCDNRAMSAAPITSKRPSSCATVSPSNVKKFFALVASEPPNACKFP